MPSLSTITDDDKAKIKAAVPTRVLSAARARIYSAHPQQKKWSYTGLEGALVFNYDKSDDTFHFKMVDLEGAGALLWKHELYQNLEYYVEHKFFHSFEGDQCMIGFIFENEIEADSFCQKVISERDSKVAKSEKKKKKKAVKEQIDKAMLSSLQSGSFVQVAPMGYDKNGFTSKAVDPSWTQFMEILENSGVSKQMINKDQKFISDLTRIYQESTPEAKKPKPIPPTRRPPPPARAQIKAPPPPSRVQDSLTSPTGGQIKPPTPPNRAQDSPTPPTPTQIKLPPARVQNIPSTPTTRVAPPPPALPHVPPTRGISPGPGVPRTPVIQPPKPPTPARPLSTAAAAAAPPPRPSTLSARPPLTPARSTEASEAVHPPAPPGPTLRALRNRVLLFLFLQYVGLPSQIS